MVEVGRERSYSVWRARALYRLLELKRQHLYDLEGFRALEELEERVVFTRQRDVATLLLHMLRTAVKHPGLAPGIASLAPSLEEVSRWKRGDELAVWKCGVLVHLLGLAAQLRDPDRARLILHVAERAHRARRRGLAEYTKAWLRISRKVPELAGLPPPPTE